MATAIGMSDDVRELRARMKDFIDNVVFTAEPELERQSEHGFHPVFPVFIGCDQARQQVDREQPWVVDTGPKRSSPDMANGVGERPHQRPASDRIIGRRDRLNRTGANLPDRIVVRPGREQMNHLGIDRVDAQSHGCCAHRTVGVRQGT